MLKRIIKFLAVNAIIIVFLVGAWRIAKAEKIPKEIKNLQKTYCSELECKYKKVDFEQRPDGSIWAIEIDTFDNILDDCKITDEEDAELIARWIQVRELD